MGISQKLFDLIPNTAIRNKKFLQKLYFAGDIMGRPMENRLIMGGTAILTQPYIDAHNKRVDEDTAKSSSNRTIGKIISGTLVGCIVRGGVWQFVKRCTDTDISKDRWDNLLTPRNFISDATKINKNKMQNYKTVAATLISLVIMLFTNFLIDRPLTNIISNFLNKQDKIQPKGALPADFPPQEHKSSEEKMLDKFNRLSGGIS